MTQVTVFKTGNDSIESFPVLKIVTHFEMTQVNFPIEITQLLENESDSSHLKLQRADDSIESLNQ